LPLASVVTLLRNHESLDGLNSQSRIQRIERKNTQSSKISIEHWITKHRDDLSPEEKVVLYGHQLHRDREYLQQAWHPAKQAIPAPVAGAAAGGSDIDQQILESVSTLGQRKAHSLLKHLKNSKVLTWTPEGEIS
jgi:hypothetical protein